jgi:hypothetical protein
VAVEAQLGGVREIRAELQEERAEVGVDGIDVELVDHPGGLHDPRIRLPVGVAASFGAKHHRLLLRPANEQHPLLGGEPGQVLAHHVVLALPLGEVHPGQPLVTGEAAHPRAERVGDLPQRRGRRDRQPQLPLDIAEQPTGVLQLRNVDVAVQPVHALHLEHDMVGQDISDGAR